MTTHNDTYDDIAYLIKGWRESIPKWEAAAKALRDAGYRDDECARPGGYSAAQCDANAAECRAHLAKHTS